MAARGRLFDVAEDAHAMSLFEIGNYCEAGLWAVIGVCFAAFAVRRSGALRGRLLLVAATFLAFGGSDVVEVQSGAWWRPWWLLAWKAACLLILVWQLISFLRLRKQTAAGKGS